MAASDFSANSLALSTGFLLGVLDHLLVGRDDYFHAAVLCASFGCSVRHDGVVPSHSFRFQTRSRYALCLKEIHYALRTLLRKLLVEGLAAGIVGV